MEFLSLLNQQIQQYHSVISRLEVKYSDMKSHSSQLLKEPMESYQFEI